MHSHAGAWERWVECGHDEGGQAGVEADGLTFCCPIGPIYAKLPAKSPFPFSDSEPMLPMQNAPENQDDAEVTTMPATSPVNPPPGSFFTRPLVQIFLIALVGLLAYSCSFQVPFVLDDELSIAENPVIRDLGKFLTGEGYAWKPRRFVGYLTIALNYRLGGLDVTGYHIFNLAVHLAAACLVYTLVRLTLRTPFFRIEAPSSGENPSFTTKRWSLPPFIPLFAGLLFVAHPVQTQAVTYVIQRLASLTALFYLLSLVLYVKARLSGLRSAASFLCYAGAALSAGLAVYTKEIAFTLPLAVVLYEFCFFKLSARTKLVFLSSIGAAVISAPLLLVASGRPLAGTVADLLARTRLETALPRLDYLFTQFRVIVTYLRLLVFPVNQNLDYDYPIYSSFLAPPVFLSFLLLLTLFVLALYAYFRSQATGGKLRNCPAVAPAPGASHSEVTGPDPIPIPGQAAPGCRLPVPELRLASFGMLWFFLTLAIESSLIPIADVIFEHRLYLPAAGAFITMAALAALLLRTAPRGRVVLGAAAVIAVLAAATFARNLVWSDPLALAQDVAAKSPQKARPHYNLALALQREGRLNEAFAEAATSSRLDPVAAKPRNVLGMLYNQQGSYHKAIAELSEAVRLDPGFAVAHANLGDALAATGLKEQALEHYFIALRLRPADAQNYHSIGLIYGETGRLNQAIPFFQSAASLAPADPTFSHNLQRALQLSAPQR